VIGITRIIVLLVPVIAGCFLLAGYLLNQIWARNERRAKAFAEALAAVEEEWLSLSSEIETAGT
jgi:hypothetical protein